MQTGNLIIYSGSALQVQLKAKHTVASLMSTSDSPTFTERAMSTDPIALLIQIQICHF